MVRVELPYAQQASLGFKGEIISAEGSKYYNIPRGIYIREVKSGSPAEEAGIKPGYIITAINGRPVYSPESYEKIMSYTQGGSKGTVTVKKPVEGEYVEETYNVTFSYRETGGR
jgi:serine protease Do